MKKILVAIGGGENGRILENGEKTPYETNIIDNEIIKLTNKKNPNFLFIGHAMNFNEEIEISYYETMKKIYQEKGCNCKNIMSSKLQNINIIQEKINWADIIYVGGGDTLSMIKLWKQTGFDKILKEAWENGKIICGISAGAVCWFNSCNSETENNEFTEIECLNWYNLFATPHINEKGRYESAKEQLKNNKKVGIMLSNCSAIEIIDDKYRIITSKNNAYCKKGYWTKNKYIEIELKTSSKFKNITELLNNN